MDTIVQAVVERTANVVQALSSLGPDGLMAPSRLPGWTCLTIACHLRYGAEALAPMTAAALAGSSAAFYPGGRAQQRPGTLVPGPRETPEQVVKSLAHRSQELHEAWRCLDPTAWSVVVEDPDIGPVTLGDLALLCLTEVEVHGSDLGVGLDAWSEVFVDTALPFRVGRLAKRELRQPVVDQRAGSWLLVASDGPTYLVEIEGPMVNVSTVKRQTHSTAVIEASGRDLLALLLGRPCQQVPHISGDLAFGQGFARYFPGP